MASTRHWAALKHMITSTEKSDILHNLLKQSETELTDKTMKMMQFFHERYHIDSSLSEQRQD